jgi:DNA-binding transcriptional LysR family regulator
VADELHFSRAAEQLHVSQPALSKQIRQLERELRLPLFRRDRRRVELTAAGATLLPLAHRLLHDWEEASAQTAARASEEARVLHVGFQTSVGGSLYQDVTARFAEIRPGWRLTLRQHPWTDPTAGLLDGSADAAILWLPTGAEDVVDARPLRSESRLVALPRGHRLARRKVLRMADLLDEPFVALPEAAGPLRDYWLALDHRGGRPALIGAEASSSEETFEAVAAGQGIHLIAEGNARLYARPDIVCCPVSDLEPSRLAIAWRRNDRRDAVRDLVAAAVEVARMEASADT